MQNSLEQLCCSPIIRVTNRGININKGEDGLPTYLTPQASILSMPITGKACTHIQREIFESITPPSLILINFITTSIVRWSQVNHIQQYELDWRPRDKD